MSNSFQMFQPLIDFFITTKNNNSIIGFHITFIPADHISTNEKENVFIKKGTSAYFKIFNILVDHHSQLIQQVSHKGDDQYSYYIDGKYYETENKIYFLDDIAEIAQSEFVKNKLSCDL